MHSCEYTWNLISSLVATVLFFFLSRLLLICHCECDTFVPALSMNIVWILFVRRKLKTLLVKLLEIMQIPAVGLSFASSPQTHTHTQQSRNSGVLCVFRICPQAKVFQLNCLIFLNFLYLFCIFFSLSLYSWFLFYFCYYPLWLGMQKWNKLTVALAISVLCVCVCSVHCAPYGFELSSWRLPWLVRVGEAVRSFWPR